MGSVPDPSPDSSPGSRPDATPPIPAPAPAASPTLAEALGALGGLMLDAGYAVTDVAHTLRAVARAAGTVRAEIGVLPQAVLVDTDGQGAGLHPATGALLTFDQVGRASRLVARASAGGLAPADLLAHVAAVRADARARPAWLAILGSGFMSLGIAVVFGVPSWAIGMAGLLGLLVGVAIIVLSRDVRIAQLLPFLTAAGSTALLAGAASAFGLGPVPLLAACAPLVVLIPGATVTNGVVELSAGDVVSGGGRFISGLVIWALLGAGIYCGAALAGVRLDGTALSAAGGAGGLWGAHAPGWVGWPATALVGFGVGIFFSASWRQTVAIIVTLLLTYGIVVVAQPHVGAPVAAGIAAAIILAGTRALELAVPRFPSVVVFRPAYWLLVPGSFGLVGLTAGRSGLDFVATTLGIILALTVGTQIGALTLDAVVSTRRALRAARAARVKGAGRRGR